MVDPILSLAVSMHANKGVYAVLLASGVSHSSGIPTGWDIVQDLIRRLAHLRSEACEPNPDAWYRTAFNSEPEYSEILAQIAKTPAERGQVLRGYFEPTAEEREEGRKQPTTAHRAIAELVAKGYVRVIITTNFDRLMEQALSAIGIQPAVISTPDGVHGALPLTHSQGTVIKINGDYLDTRLKNTRGELEEYEQPISALLDRVFDEYGLIICGWSADWDIALRAALERCSSHRFTTYWASRGSLSERASTLAGLRRAAILPIADADSFFRELSEKVAALESFSAVDPLSASVAVARLKKYLKNDAYQIDLRDLLLTETERVFKAINDHRFPVSTRGNMIDGNTIVARMRLYEAELHVFLPLVICSAYWADAKHDSVVLSGLKRLADQHGLEGGMDVWLNLRRYPSLLSIYGMGLAALAANNYRFLRALFSLNISTDQYKPEQPTNVAVHSQAVLAFKLQKMLPGQENQHTPLSNHLFSVLREPLRNYVPSDQTYDDLFDWFEYLFCLTHCDAQITRQELAAQKEADPEFTLWAPPGRFLWKHSNSEARGIQQRTELRSGESYQEIVASVLQAGFFSSGGDLREDKYINVKAAFDRHVSQIRSQNGIW